MVFEMKPAAIYARFSTELQNEKSTDDQIALCRTYAARHQLNIVATFEDKARSGASVFGRDGLMQLMDAACQNLFTVVIVEALVPRRTFFALSSRCICPTRPRIPIKSRSCTASSFTRGVLGNASRSR
jgi:resolvase-like protein